MNNFAQFISAILASLTVIYGSMHIAIPALEGPGARKLGASVFMLMTGAILIGSGVALFFWAFR